jgi:DNA-nicking Smr family endonuclease
MAVAVAVARRSMTIAGAPPGGRSYTRTYQLTGPLTLHDSNPAPPRPRWSQNHDFHRASGGTRRDDERVKLKLDLHEIYNRGGQIDRALRAIIDEAVAKRAPLVEIIPGKGSGQLKKHVLRFLDQKEIKALYHRVEKDSDNFGRVFVHFRWK